MLHEAGVLPFSWLGVLVMTSAARVFLDQQIVQGGYRSYDFRPSIGLYE